MAYNRVLVEGDREALLAALEVSAVVSVGHAWRRALEVAKWVSDAGWGPDIALVVANRATVMATGEYDDVHVVTALESLALDASLVIVDAVHDSLPNACLGALHCQRLASSGAPRVVLLSAGEPARVGRMLNFGTNVPAEPAAEVRVLLDATVEDAVRQLPSGDVVVFAESTEAAARIRKSLGVSAVSPDVEDAWIPRTAHVVDCGWVAEGRRVLLGQGVDGVEPVRVSADAARRRASAALSTVTRLYDRTAPAVIRGRWEEALRVLALGGVGNLARFPYILAPTRRELVEAVARLIAVGVLDESGAPSANATWRLPCSIEQASVLESSRRAGYSRTGTLVAAAMEEREDFGDPAARAHFAGPGDVEARLSMLRAYDASGRSAAWCARRALDPTVLSRVLAESERLSPGSTDSDSDCPSLAIRRWLARAFPHHIATLNAGHYTIGTKPFNLHPSTTLRGKPDRILFQHIHQDYLLLVTPYPD